MNPVLRFVLLVALVAGLFFLKDRVVNKSKVAEEAKYTEIKSASVLSSSIKKVEDSFVDDSIYHFDDSLFYWVASTDVDSYVEETIDLLDKYDGKEVIEIDWDVLMDINYRLKYFESLEMEIYAPVFTKAVQALHEKKVAIEGFVIPFDEEENLLSLSFNPNASCFFCGAASPASVLSLYLKDTRKTYKTDDYRKFEGVLHLNEDDPNEFYYILKNAQEAKE